jgi:16S rRNA (cytosine967-C5)-methyltransferase
MGIAPARRVAFDVLLRVETESAFAAELMHAPRSAFQSLSELDRALCTQLVIGTLRWRSRLDSSIAPHTRLDGLDPEVLTALRLAAFQLGFLDRIPARAAVNDGVELVKRARKRSAAALANAVLRKIVAEATKLRPTDAPMPSVADLAVNWAHPEWLVQGWADEFGMDIAAVICRHNQTQPPLAIHVDSPQVAEELMAQGIALTAGTLTRGARLVSSGDLLQTRAYREHRAYIQDEASQLVAAIVGTGERILDCCAAPGGKTRAIAVGNPGAQVVAADLYPHRVRTMSKLGMPANVNIIVADAQRLPLPGGFDRILADVPCSGTGTLARNPEIKWRLQPADLQDLQRRQIKILTAALGQLAPGGRLVYSTCSLEHAENEDVVRAVLASQSAAGLLPITDVLEEIKADLVWSGLPALVRGEFLRTLPGVHPGDGFFAAVFVRRGAQV